MRVLVAAIVRPGGLVAPEAAWYAETIAGQFADTTSAVGGFLAAAAGAGLETLPLGVTATDAAGGISRHALDLLRTRLFSELRGWKVDAVYLALPGATPIVEPAAALHDGEGAAAHAEAELAAAIRQRLGPTVPIVVVSESEPPPDARPARARRAARLSRRVRLRRVGRSVLGHACRARHGCRSHDAGDRLAGAARRSARRVQRACHGVVT